MTQRLSVARAGSSRAKAPSAFTPHPDHRLLTEDDVAALLGVPSTQLEQWREAGDGPPWIKVTARIVRYPAATALFTPTPR